MAIEIAALATSVVSSFLLPYAKAGLTKISESVSEAIGPEAAEYASDVTSKVWDHVKGAFSSPKEEAALDLFKENPEDMQPVLAKKLREKMEQDSNLAQTLSDLINEPGPDGNNTGAQIMNAGVAGIVDLRGADLSQAQNLTITGANVSGKPTSSE